MDKKFYVALALLVIVVSSVTVGAQVTHARLMNPLGSGGVSSPVTITNGGTGTTTGGVIGGVEYYNGTSLTNNSALTTNGTGSLTLGASSVWTIAPDSTNGNQLDFSPSTSLSPTYLNVTQTGNVGIGSTTPNDLLSLFIGGDYASHPATSVFNIASSSSGLSTTTIFNVGNDGTTIVGSTSANAGILPGSLVVKGNTQMNANMFITANNSGLFFNTVANFQPGIEKDLSNNIKFIPNTTVNTNSEMYYSPVGNLGIGSTSPSSKLSVFLNANDTSPQTSAFSIGSSTATATTTLMNVLNTGFVGFGTSTPLYPLSVENDQNADIYDEISNYTSGTAATAGIRFDTANGIGGSLKALNSSFTPSGDGVPSTLQLRSFSAATGGLELSAAAGALTFFTNALQRLTILSSGLVGIGTTTPIATFQATTPTANATTSVEFGKAGQTKGTCLTIAFDTAGSPVYEYFAAGATTPTYQNGGTPPSGCQD